MNKHTRVTAVLEPTEYNIKIISYINRYFEYYRIIIFNAKTRKKVKQHCFKIEKHIFKLLRRKYTLAGYDVVGFARYPDRDDKSGYKYTVIYDSSPMAVKYLTM